MSGKHNNDVQSQTIGNIFCQYYTSWIIETRVLLYAYKRFMSYIKKRMKNEIIWNGYEVLKFKVLTIRQFMTQTKQPNT